MLTAEQQEEIEYIKDRMLAKFPLLGVTVANLEVEANDRVKTADTNGHKIRYSPKFFKTLSDDEAIFVFAHEVFHVAFEHMSRRNGRDGDLWNIATDSVINQLLKQEGLPIRKGLVDIPQALGHSAEEMYDLLLERRKEKQKWEDHIKEMMEKAKEMADQQREQNPLPEQNDADEPEQEQPEEQTEETDNSQQEQSEAQTEEDIDPLDKWANQPPQFPEFDFDITNHDVWDETDEEPQTDDIQQIPGNALGDMEKQFYQRNQREMAKQAMQYFQSQNIGETGTFHIGGNDLSEVNIPKELNWKRLLQKSCENEVLGWSTRRSCKEDDFKVRLEELEREDKAHTEVMLDISASVDVELLKEFLRQLKPLLKDSTLEVGYFNHKATGFTKIKTAKDIEKLDVPCPYGGTNLDVAVRSFSKNKRTNKIVFSDGAGYMPLEDLKKVNVIWVIYGHEVGDFRPCCGKVIRVDERKIMEEKANRNFLINQANGTSRK